MSWFDCQSTQSQNCIKSMIIFTLIWLNRGWFEFFISYPSYLVEISVEDQSLYDHDQSFQDDYPNMWINDGGIDNIPIR